MEEGELRPAVTAMMAAAWRDPGYCVPNSDVYPHQWLWDSCFHALVWIRLSSGRGVIEVESALAGQDADGFVPHMTYWSDPGAARFWDRARTSAITQPPMYGHAVAELVRAGAPVGRRTIELAVRGIRHLLDRPRTAAGLVPVFHPWETGCDDSPRWDSWLDCDGGPGAARIDREQRWRQQKGALVEALHRSADGAAVGSDAFVVGSVGFNALVAWNARELVEAVPAGGAGELGAAADELGRAVADRWWGDGTTWVDDGPPSGRIRTLDAMLGLLVDPRDDAFDALIEPRAFGAPYGPCGVHRAEPTYEPGVYWRGPAWPQLTYLLLIAARRAGRDRVATALAAALRAGAAASGLAEHWHPDTGAAGGAVPQTWAGLALLA